MCVPCCFCLLEFPTWNSSVTSHIASHVRIHSVSCVECNVKFESKNLLMKHLYSTHTGLPNGVSFDVSINNYERRRLKVLTQLASAESNNTVNSKLNVPVVNAMAISEPVSSCCEGSSGTDWDIPDEIDATVNKSTVEEGSTIKTASRNSVSSAIESMVNNDVLSLSDDEGSVIVAEQNVGRDMMTTVLESDDHQSASLFDNPQGFDKSGGRNGRRKARKPMRVAAEENEETPNSNAGSENQVESTCDDHWVEIVPATQPLAVQCSKCSYTCNTELQLKVRHLLCDIDPVCLYSSYYKVLIGLVSFHCSVLYISITIQATLISSITRFR